MNKMIEISTIAIVVSAIFLENKCYPQVLLDEHLYESNNELIEIEIKNCVLIFS